MKTTRAMLVIGVLMLVLAVIVAQGLRPEETATVSAPVVSGTVSRAPEHPVPVSAEQPVAANVPSTAPPVVPPALPSGDKAPLRDPETLKMNSATPAGLPEPAAGETAGRVTDNGKSAASPAVPIAIPSAPANTEQPPAARREERPRTPERFVVTTGAPKTLTAGQKAISRTRLEIGPRTTTLRLTGASALQGKAFALKEPDRVVVDLNGFWGVNLGRTPVNPFIKSVRAGSQETNTRLVVDLHRAPKSFKLVQVDPRTLELQIR